ncbi:MAG: DUF1573 domain-containing protein [Prevotella sp.]|nr:DUF1573 domain-containing protein [Prevotella sp.]
MKTYKTIFLLAVLLLSCGICNAQRIKTDNAVIDLGQVEYLRAATATFVLKNGSRRPLTIERVDTGCACSVADYPSRPVAAGETFTVSVTYDARQMGHFDKIIEVYAAGDPTPARLEMRGIVVEEPDDDINRYPFRLGELSADCNAVDFDDVRKGEVLTQKFHIYNPTSTVVNPQILHLPAYIKAEISPAKLAPGRSAVVSLTLDTQSLRDFGYRRTYVYLAANLGERVSADKEITVGITLLPPAKELSSDERQNAPIAETSAERVNLPVKGGKKRTATVDIRNAGRSTLEIYSMRMMAEGLVVSLSRRRLEPGETAKLKIKIKAKELKNARRMPRIVLITNDPERPKITVDVDINEAL